MPSARRSFDVGAGVEQRARRLDVAAAHREQQRRERAGRRLGARRRRRRAPGPGWRQRCFRPPPTSARSARASLPVALTSAPASRAACTASGVAGARRRHQRRLAARERRVRIGAGRDAAARSSRRCRWSPPDEAASPRAGWPRRRVRRPGSARAVSSRSSCSTAQCSAVVPSASAAFTSAFCASSRAPPWCRRS